MPLWLVFLGLVFGLGLLSVSVVRVRIVKAYEDGVKIEDPAFAGQDRLKDSTNDIHHSTSDSSEETLEEEVSYYLPYPGILPDHPMYWLKMIRDRVQLWLTTGNLSKTERLLLYADKRLGAGWALVEGNKTSLGITTLTKAEKYLEQAVKLGASLGEEGEEKKLKDKLIKATKKHIEVLNIVKNLVGEKEAGMVEQMIKMQTKEMVKERGLTVKVDFGDEVLVETKVEAETALEALEMAGKENNWEIKARSYDFGNLVEEVDGKANTAEKSWIYFVNGKSGEVGAGKMKVGSEDVVEWKYIEPIF